VPAGEKLPFRFQTTEKNREIKYYATSACTRCSIKAQCTRNKGGRRITRWVHEDVLDEMQSRVSANQEKMELRKQLAEHPLGTFKHHWHQGHFLTRKLPNVRAEMALTVLIQRMREMLY